MTVGVSPLVLIKWATIVLLGIVFPMVLLPVIPEITKVHYPYAILSSFSGIWLMWEGNIKIILWLEKKIPWQVNTRKRLFYQLIYSGLYTNLVLFIIWAIAINTFVHIEIKWYHFLYKIVISSEFVLMLGALYESGYFLTQWKKTIAKAEKLEKENIQARYDALKNQVNPHFLFNSLNTLTTLITEDQDKAVEYVQKLSSVYRYILQSHQQDVVSMEKEMELLNGYLFLLQSRFEDRLFVEVDIPREAFSTVIPPLTIQLLVENAVKHNKATKNNPLKVRIFIDGDDLWVINTLNLKMNESPANSTGTGLVNIRNRYQLLTPNKVILRKNEKEFMVILPLIYMDTQTLSNESTDNRR